MTARLLALCLDATDPERLSSFWAGLLGWQVVHDAYDAVTLLPSDDTGFWLRVLPTRLEKVGQNRMHLDLTSSSLEDQQSTVRRCLELGARHVDVGQRPEEGHVVLADPEGNELCVIEPGNRFLADCGFVGALACEGSRDVGLFWSRALGWPLVWDQNQETAIRAPYGGPKISWGGPPLKPQSGRNRLHLDLAPAVAADQQAEVDRLLALGATRADPVLEAHRGHDTEAGRVVLTDPDGNEFCLSPTPG